eukprot:5923211-Lingulodinium_polyedra.AAC.1
MPAAPVHGGRATPVCRAYAPRRRRRSLAPARGSEHGPSRGPPRAGSQPPRRRPLVPTPA